MNYDTLSTEQVKALRDVAPIVKPILDHLRDNMLDIADRLENGTLRVDQAAYLLRLAART